MLMLNLMQKSLTRFFSALAVTFLTLSIFGNVDIHANTAQSGGGNVTIINNLKNIPIGGSYINSKLTFFESVSVCFDGTVEANNIKEGESANINLDPGNYQFKVFETRQFDSIFENCSFFNTSEVPILEGNILVSEFASYQLELTGNGFLEDPRLNGMLDASPNVSYLFPSQFSEPTAGIRVEYPDYFFISADSLFFGPMASTFSTCIDTGNGPVATAGENPGSIFTEFNGLPKDTDITIFPVDQSGGCSDTRGSATINMSGNVNYGTVRYTEGYKLSGLNYTVDEIILPLGQNQNYSGATEDTVFEVTNATQGLLNGLNYNSGVVVELVTQSNQGTATVNPDGTFSFNPNTNFNGNATFEFRIVDAIDNTKVSPTYTTTITFDPIDDTPEVVNDTLNFEVNKNQSLEISPVSLTNAVNDPDGDPLSVLVQTNTQNGTLEILSNGNFQYTPNTDFVGNDTFTFVVGDDPNQTNILPDSNLVTDNNSSLITVNISVLDNTVTTSDNSTLADTGSELPLIILITTGATSLIAIAYLTLKPKFSFKK